MIDFEAAKSLDMREVARLYGVDLNRHGKGLCPFHSEKTPSFKAYSDERGYYCYGCGSGGDAVNFVARLHGLSPLDALKQLNKDFALGLNFGEAVDFEAVKKRRAEQEIIKNFESWEKWAFRAVCKYNHDLQDTIKALAPKSPEDEPAPAWSVALNEVSKIEYWLDVLITGSDEDKINFYATRRNEVKQLIERQKTNCENLRIAVGGIG